MGTNNSKALKTQFEKGHYHDEGLVGRENLEQVRSILIEVDRTQKFFCLLRELDTEHFTQTLSKVDEFLEKMNNTSSFISSFLFITESSSRSSVFNLIFQSGQRNLTFSNLLSECTSLLHSVISALEFLESIHLFYPQVKLDHVVRTSHGLVEFKLLNQFCFSDFLLFITNVYLSDTHSSSQLNDLLKGKRQKNLQELREMVSQLLRSHPQVRQPSHFLSNLVPFELFLLNLNNKQFSFKIVKNKFMEFFDVKANKNKENSLGTLQLSNLRESSSPFGRPQISKTRLSNQK